MAIRPNILFNNGTGSDTAASGAGPGTALFGTAAALASSTTVTLTVDGPTLTGVAVDGSACLWVDSSSGRQFSRITAIDNVAKTVTVAATYSVTEGTRNWGIGGKRKTLDDADSRTLFTSTGWDAEWCATLEDDQSLTSKLVVGGPNSGGLLTIKSSTAGTVRKITQTANDTCIEYTVAAAAQINFIDLKVENSNGTKTSANGFTAAGAGSTRIMKFLRCTIGDVTNTLKNGWVTAGGSAATLFIDCEIAYCSEYAVDNPGFFLGCWIHDTDGVRNAGGGMVLFHRCLVEDNVIDGFLGQPTGGLFQLFLDSTFHDNAGDNIDLTSGSGGSYAAVVRGCNITGAGGYGIRDRQDGSCDSDYNNYGTGGTANTSGATIGSITGTSDLTVDPGYVNAAGNDFGVGSNVQDQGFPDAARNIGNNNSATVNYSAIGAAEPQVSGGGGGGGFVICG